ncbi:MAG: hypothetical protein IIA41_07870, partial [SAR324 cluster bacterium]|nr:hypothetical protein [SAR324 cluster bacterium]
MGHSSRFLRRGTGGTSTGGRPTENSNHVEGRGASAGETPANEFYYFRVGLGDWRGAFHFRFTGQRKFWADSLGLKNRFLALSMAAVSALFGKARILSHVEGSLTDGKAGVAWNSVRIVKFGITLYLLRERYVLNSDGRNVRVVSDERFGPIPFLFRTAKEHPAEILDGGMRAIYHIPLLGTKWIAEYTVHPDRDHIDAVMRCPWGEASEVIDRVSEQPPIEDSAGTPAQRLNALAGRIEGYRRKYEARRDDRAIFAFVYGGITRNLAAELEQSPGQFDDPDWVVDLDLRFAEDFFEAMDAIDAAGTDSADAERRPG